MKAIRREGNVVETRPFLLELIEKLQLQLPTGTHDCTTPMSRSLNEDQQQLEQSQQPQQQQQQQQTHHQHHQQQQGQQMQPAGTPTSSSSLSSPQKDLPQQQQSPGSNASGSVTKATDASSVPQQPSSAPNTNHTLQQQQNVASASGETSSAGGSSSSCSNSGSVEANNANITSTPGGERTGSGLSESEGRGRGGRGGGTVTSDVDGGVVSHSSGESAGGGGSEESTFGGVVVGEKRAIEDSTGSVTDVVGRGASDGVVGASAVGKLYTKTNTTASSSFAPVVASAGVAAGGQTVVSASGTASTTVAATAAASTTGSPTVSKKRIKLESEPEHDISALKKLILEHKYMRLRSIKEKYNEHVAELFFLQTGGNMMEYPVWRKKPPTPAFTSFIRSYKLEPLSSNLEEAGEALKQQSSRALSGISITPGSNNLGSLTPTVSGNGSSSSSSSIGDDSITGLPQGAEIKIPGVGATPVAVSTTLPAAVAQLSQQGGTPIIPDRVGIGISSAAVDRKRPINSSTALGGHMVKSELLETGNASPGHHTIGSNGPNLPNIRGSNIAGTRGSGGTSGLSSRGLNNGQQHNGSGGLGNGSNALSGSMAGQQQAAGSSNGPEQYTNKARQEVFVIQRVQELQKEGLWTEKRLPKVQEPPRPKAHWDYLLEEMVWLAADFAQERKWKKAAARKCARMVQKHFQDKALAAQRAEKAQELQLKRIAAFVAKEIKTFWSNAEKLVEYKQQTKLDEKRKKALDQQLSFIVDQTEKYSQQLVEGMNKAPVPGVMPAGSKAESLNSSRISSPLRSGLAGGSDDEFCPEAESSDDDEETIAKAEAEAAAEAEDGTKDEVAALQKESEMDLDDFLKNLPKDYLENRDKIVFSDSGDGEDDDDGEEDKKGATTEGEDGDKDFSADEDSMDDEDTIREQEKNEKNQDHQKELDELNADNEMTIEELMAKYKNPPPADEKMDVDSDDDVNEPESTVRDRKRRRTRSQPMSDSSDDEAKEEDDDNSEGLTGSGDDDDISDDESEGSEEAMDADEEEAIGLKNLLDDETGTSGETASGSSGHGKSQSDKDDMLNDAAAIAESIQPKGNTLSSTSVVTPIPTLLKHSLREYQHIGLDWLVTMHDRKLNGILADEMGLGKTIQTISLLAHLACVKGNWGPHLIIVPSSVMLNWEMEFKKWCPGFKILTYYGTPKERKQKRTGWTKVNAFHVCITSYKLVIQDHQSFRRKKWKYLILDEAQNIKNFKSQRWQLLLNFQTEQRLLLTGTPLQNNLMELWSLMHFLMPHVFQSHREFKEWFSNPMTGMIEGNSEYNETIIKRLHKVCTLYVLRPFLLRRLKSEVEKQMPKKYEHVVMCRLSKRQRFLYDDFMSRAKTRETLASGNLLSVINVLMQLRKVCNHPNMFEERPTISPFRMEGISIKTASLVYNMFNYDPFTQIDLSSLNLVLIQLELLLPAYVAHRTQHLCMPKRLIEEIDSTPMPPPRCPTGKLRLHVRIPDVRVQEMLSGGSRAGVSAITGVRIGTSPAMKTEGTKFVPLVNHEASLDKKSPFIGSSIQSRVIDIRRRAAGSSTVMMMMGGSSGSAIAGLDSSAVSGSSRSMSPGLILRKRSDIVGSGSGVMTVSGQLHQPQNRLNAGQVLQIIPQVSSGGMGSNASQSYIITGRLQTAVGGGSSQTIFHRPSLTSAGGVHVVSKQRIATLQSMGQTNATSSAPRLTSATSTASGAGNRMVQNVGQKTQISSTLAATIMKQLKHSTAKSSDSTRISEDTEMDDRERTEFYLACIEETRTERRREVLELLGRINAKRCDATPIYGKDLRETLCAMIEDEFRHRPDELIPFGVASSYYVRRATAARCGGGINAALVASWSLSEAIKTIDQRAAELRATISNFVLFVPAVCAPTPLLQVSHPHPSKLNAEQQWEATMAEQIQPAIQLLHPIISAMSTQFPDPRLIQYDCGKLQTLDRLLKKLKSEGHRVLIFTQMTRMLDVLEAFLNYHGHIYLRLDGTTKVEQRQVLMERFNNDRRMFAFILSTRSGGVGINLTGADTVIFYDSDWNPTMDAQAQDRCHRIGQTRDVHIYRLVSEKTIEENILKKANQKRILGDLAIEGGNFTTAYFKSSTTIQDLFTVDSGEQDASARLVEVLERDRDRKDRLHANLSATSAVTTASTPPAAASTGGEVVDTSKSAINVFESALAAAEDDQDVQAAKFAKAEASADLDEFDENIPIDEDKAAAGVEVEGKEPELSKAEKEVQNLIKQLSPVERYAMRFVEDTEGTWTAVQLKAVEQEIEQQKRDWEANRLAEQRRNEEAARKREAEEHADLLTFSREDAKNQVIKTHPSNRARSGGSSKNRLHNMRRNDRTSTKTNRDGGTLRTRTNSRGHKVSSLTKFDGGNRGVTGRSDRRLTSGRRVVPSAKQQQKHHSSGTKHGLANRSKAVGGSILGKRKYHETVSKSARSQNSSSSRVANLRQTKGATRNAKHPRRNVSKASLAEDDDDEDDDDEEDEEEEEDQLTPEYSTDESVEDEDIEENGSDSEVIGGRSAEETEEEKDEGEDEEQDPLGGIGVGKMKSKKPDATSGGSSGTSKNVPPVITLRQSARRASVTARAIIGSITQKAGGNNVKQSPKVNATTYSSSRTKIIRQVQSPVGSVKANNTSDRSAVSSTSSSTSTVDTRPLPEQQRDRVNDAVATATLVKPLDEFDSECSLDVMIDSNDAPDSDSNQMNNYYSNSAGMAMHQDDDARVGATDGSSVKDQSRPTSRGGRTRDSRSKTPSVCSTSPMVPSSGCDLPIDETSDDVDESSNATKTTPRTRSRGTVKINLWTLDDTPMLPVSKRSNRSKTPQLSQQTNHAGDCGDKSMSDEKESEDSSKMDASPVVENAKVADDRSTITVVDNNHDLNHSSNSSTPGESLTQKTVNLSVTKGANMLRNLKVVVNDLLRTPDTTKKATEMSDGFRTPTPTNTKLRRLKRLSVGGGRTSSPSVMNAGVTNNRTLDSWLMKDTGRKEEGGQAFAGENHVGEQPPAKISTVAGRTVESKHDAAHESDHEEKDPLANGDV
uniref:Helicase domino n=1 Tax=Anopheles epiroticus TaxID=199890 RepID=A0A182PG61_9DIPT